MIPLEKVNSIILRFDELEKLLSKTNIDKKEFVKNSKEYSSIGSIIKEAKDKLNWHPLVNLDKGIESTIDYFKNI